MNLPCITETSQACALGCCTSSFLALTQSQKPYQHEFAVTTASFLYLNTKFTNHESLPSLQKSFSDFIRAYPQYLQTDQADHIRANEYNHLSLSHHVYLNYTGHGLFSYSQLQLQRSPAESSQSHGLSALDSYLFELSSKSVNLSAELSDRSQESDFQSKMRKRIMDFMNLSESDYYLVFTPDHSSGFKCLAELYPFQSNPNLLTVYDCENEAVESMIEISKKRGAHVNSVEFLWPNLQIRSEKLRKKLTRSKRKRKERGLFVFPLQSRVTGARYSYSWMSLAHENGWHVLLDACALGSKDMETLGLSMFKPDFLICSFFKVLRENPSGFGCFFIKKSSAWVFTQSNFGPNSENLTTVTAKADTRIKRAPESTSGSSSIQTKNDENTLEFAKTCGIACNKNTASCSEIVELEPQFEHAQSRNTDNRTTSQDQELEFKGLDHADSLGLILISRRAKYLTNWLVNALMSLQHPSSENGIPLVRIYGPKIKFNHGPSIAFDVFDWQGVKIDPLLVQNLAERNNIFLGCGILQNIRCANKRRIITGEAKDRKRRFCGSGLSVITVSLGFLTNFEDVYRVWVFVARFLDADFLEKERWRCKALHQLSQT